MATMEQQYQNSGQEQTFYVLKEWNAHKEKMMDHIATIMDQQKVVYDGLSETWDTHGKDLMAQVGCAIKDGNFGCVMLGHLMSGFSYKIYLRQFKATNERMNGHFKVLRSFHDVVARADALIKDIGLTLDRRGEGALSEEHYNAWARASNDLSGQFSQVLKIGNIEKYELLDLWEGFHVKGHEIISGIPDEKKKKDISRAWDAMATQMNAQVLQIIIEVRNKLEAIERDIYRSELRLQQELSTAFRQKEVETVDVAQSVRPAPDDYSENT